MATRRYAPHRPRSEVEARARSIRKLSALQKTGERYLFEISGYWHEGAVSSSIDELMVALKEGISDITAAMDEELLRNNEEDL